MDPAGGSAHALHSPWPPLPNPKYATVHQHQWSVAPEAASHPERRWSSHHWGQKISTCDTDTASIALVTNLAANSVQYSHFGVQVSTRYGSVLRSYLLTYCIPTSSHDGQCHLRSAVSGLLSVPHTTTNYSDRSFAVSGPVVWNSLPAALRLDMSLSVFRRRLKTFFMSEATDSV